MQTVFRPPVYPLSLPLPIYHRIREWLYVLLQGMKLTSQEKKAGLRVSIREIAGNSVFGEDLLGGDLEYRNS